MRNRGKKCEKYKQMFESGKILEDEERVKNEDS